MYISFYTYVMLKSTSDFETHTLQHNKRIPSTASTYMKLCIVCHFFNYCHEFSTLIGHLFNDTKNLTPQVEFITT